VLVVTCPLSSPKVDGTELIRLSKSKLISGWQCGKRLWLEKYQPELVEHSAATEAMFAVGHEVGAKRGQFTYLLVR
jgi:hypothetical protein